MANIDIAHQPPRITLAITLTADELVRLANIARDGGANTYRRDDYLASIALRHSIAAFLDPNCPTLDDAVEEVIRRIRDEVGSDNAYTGRTPREDARA